MKKIILCKLLIGVLALTAFTQERSAIEELTDLSAQINENSTFREIDDAVDRAGEIYKQEKSRKFGGEQAREAEISVAYALFQIDAIRTFAAKRGVLRTDFRTLRKTSAKIRKVNLEIDELFETGIALYDTLGIKTPAVADAKLAYARHLNRFNPAGKISSRNRHKAERLEQAKKLLREALEIFRKQEKPLNDNGLLAHYYLADFQAQTGDFKIALPHYEEYISGLTKEYGPQSAGLVPALKMYGAILKTIGDDAGAAQAFERITKINGAQPNPRGVYAYIGPRLKSLKYKGAKNRYGGVLLNGTRTYTPGERFKITANEVGADGDISPDADGAYTTGGRTERRYPPFQKEIEKTMRKIFGTAVFVSVDENGRVTEVKPDTDDKKLAKKIRKNVIKWEFKPFIYKDQTRGYRGLVFYFG